MPTHVLPIEGVIMDRIELIIPTVFCILCCGYLFRVIAGLSRTVARLERQFDLVMQHSDIDVAALADQEVLALLQDGKKAEAINVYQEYTGVSIEEAKKHVEGKLSQGLK